jgi:hypothetical protein
MTDTCLEKTFETARAKAALRGIRLHRQQDEYDGDIFLAVRGMETRCFDTLAAFLEWLDRVETRGQRYGT